MLEQFSWQDRLKSFRFAFAGIATLIVEQHNARVHFLATIAVIFLGLYLQITGAEWIYLVLIISLVWVGEAFNSAIEYLADAAVPEQNTMIKKAKDVAAAGVLICAFGAVVIGILVFFPYFF